MPRPSTRHSNSRSTPMTHSFSTTSSAAADDFGGLSLTSASASSPLSSSRHSSASPSPTPHSSIDAAGPSTVRSRGSSTSSQAGAPKRRERQTRLQEHLRTVKPGSSSRPKSTLGFSASSSTASKTLPIRNVAIEEVPTTSSSRPKRKAAQKVIMQELEVDSDSEVDAGADVTMDDEVEVQEEEEQEEEESRKPANRRSRGRKAPRAAKAPREREISSLSTVSAGIDVEGMDEDEVQNRLEKEKTELMERLAAHGINPQADVLDRALMTLSNSNEKLTVDSFLRALSSLDTNRSPNSARAPLPLPDAPPALTVQVPNGNQAKRVSFSTLESPSTPSSSHSSIFPSPPSKSVSLPTSTPLAAPNTFIPVFGSSNSSVPPASVVPVPSTSASSTSTAPPPPPSASTSLFGNSMPGMGRIALTRRHTYLGVPSASDPVPSLLPAFEPARQPFSSPAKPGPSLSSKVSKLQSWLDDDDSEEEESVVKATSEKKNAAVAVDGKKEEEEDSEMEIRVGGKTVKVLRKRQLEENDGEDETTTTLSPKGKGKQRAAECLCGEMVSTEESSHGTVSCSLCETSFHLACLNVNSRRHLPLEWTCERCNSTPSPKGAIETPQKRPRTLPEMTPPPSNEPTFVSSTFSPNPRGNFAFLPDVALAPSPTSSPKRQFATVPTSPTLLSNSKVSIPATPHFGKDSDPRSDYSPCSPLFNRKSRNRLVSGVFDSAPFANEWAAEGGGGGGVNLFDSHNPFGDSHDWHDITMTPSRGLGSSTSGGGLNGWETPFASRSRQPSTLHPQTLPHHHRTPSQDIFSGSALDYVQGGRHTAPAQMFAQRLFGEDPASPSRNNHPATNGNGSPHGSKRGVYRHGRNPSSSYILPPHAFSSPSSSSAGSIFPQYPPTPHSGSTSSRMNYGNSLFPPSPSRQPLQSSAMKTSLSAPGMLRTGSDGLGIDYEEQTRDKNDAAQFDDLLL
ncbi:hypothetical protein JCM5350_008205 [Sporobolomyces pararoseus]